MLHPKRPIVDAKKVCGAYDGSVGSDMFLRNHSSRVSLLCNNRGQFGPALEATLLDRCLSRVGRTWASFQEIGHTTPTHAAAVD